MQVRYNRTPRVPPVLAYHGTSSVFLDGILHNGLLPDPPRRVWAEDPNAREAPGTFTRRSLLGVYLSRNLMTAHGSAYHTIDRFGGAPLIVVVRLQPRSGVADEDAVRFTLQRSIEGFKRDRSLTYGWGEPEQGVYLLGFLASLPEEDRRHYEQSFILMAHNNLVGAGHGAMQTAVHERAFLDFLYGSLLTYWAKLEPREGNRMWTAGEDASCYRTDRPYEHVEPPPRDIDAAEALYMCALDRITRRYKRSATHGVTHDYTVGNFRVLEPVGFSGANRIVCIIEEILVPSESYVYGRPIGLVARYGRIPEQTLLQGQERLGDYWTALSEGGV